jgi:acylphosphatase
MMSQGDERVRVRVDGLVQGVWFRASTQREAQAFEITGWVKNQPDGAVTLEAQGRPEALEELLSWLRNGPPKAQVDEVDVTWTETVAGEVSFEIRR